MQSRKNTKNRPPRRNGVISVLLAEDHTILRDCLGHMLDGQEDITLVGAVGEGSEAVREVEKLAPQVALLGIALPGLSGIEATQRIAEKTPQVGVIILSAHGSHMTVRRALEAGALGYLTKTSSGDELLRAIRSVAAGKRYLARGISETFTDVVRGAKADEPIESLTPTERNILKLVAEGKSNAEAAQVLNLSPRTIETYRMRLMRKLGIEDFATLVKYAIRQGIVPLE